MGDVSAWMMNQLAGINYDERQPGFRHIRFTPHFPADMQWAKGSYDSVAGEISSEWKRTGEGKIQLTVKVPLGCTGELVLEGKTVDLTAGTHQIVVP